MATAIRPRDLTHIRGDGVPAPIRSILRSYKPQSDLGRLVRSACAYLPEHVAEELLAGMARTMVVENKLYATIRRANGKIERCGLICAEMVDTTGVNYLATYFSGAVTGANLKYHGLGTGSTAAAIGDSALVTELTTQYTPSGTRATGTAVASTNTFTSVATNTIETAGATVTEHGLFSAASGGTGTLFDRSVFTGLALAIGDSLQTTFTVTFSAGG